MAIIAMIDERGAKSLTSLCDAVQVIKLDRLPQLSMSDNIAERLEEHVCQLAEMVANEYEAEPGRRSTGAKPPLYLQTLPERGFYDAGSKQAGTFSDRSPQCNGNGVPGRVR